MAEKHHSVSGWILRSSICRTVLRRTAIAGPLLVVVSAATFVLISLTPGDAALQILGTDAPPQAYDQLRHELGLDLPVYEQFARWSASAITGDFGSSLFTSEAVWSMVADRAPVTLFLASGALLVSLVLGVALGMASAVWRGPVGRVVDVFALVGWALPAFWVSAMLILVFAVQLRWLPAVGYVPAGESLGGWLRSLVLPVIALSLGGVAAITKQTREALLEVLGSEYIKAARANGAGPCSLLFRHALKNASIRVVTVLGLLAISMLGGTVLVETVFALPGLGQLAVNSSVQQDLPVIQAIVVLFTALVVVINLCCDLAYSWLDPKVGLS